VDPAFGAYELSPHFRQSPPSSLNQPAQPQAHAERCFGCVNMAACWPLGPYTTSMQLQNTRSQHNLTAQAEPEPLKFWGMANESLLVSWQAVAPAGHCWQRQSSSGPQPGTQRPRLTSSSVVPSPSGIWSAHRWVSAGHRRDMSQLCSARHSPQRRTTEPTSCRGSANEPKLTGEAIGGGGRTVAERDGGGEADVLLQDVVPVKALCHIRAVSGMATLCDNTPLAHSVMV